MDIFEFVVLSFCNLALIYWILKSQGVASVEGYCAVFLGMAALTDNLNLLCDYFFQPGMLRLGANEFNFRAYPTMVHIVALIVLMAALFLGNPKPEPLSRNFSATQLDSVAYTGVVLLLLGLVFAGITIYLTHAYSAANFFHSIDTFRAGNPGETGGFFYRGADIAVLGMALILPSVKTKAQISLLLLGMMFVSFFLKASKGGLQTPILWAALVLYTYNPRRFWSLVKPRIVLACLVIALAGVGVKVLLLADEAKPFTLDAITESTIGAVGTRWGDQGVYRDYCQFINLLPMYHYLFEGYPEGVDALTSWFPRALNPNKKAQPTQGLGFMVHADAHTYENETPAIGLVGSVYADNGFYSLTAYLLIVGFLLGLLRRYAAGRQSALHWHISYVSFALIGGLSPEAGITGILYFFIFMFGITGLAHLIVLGVFKSKLYVGAIPAHSVIRRGFRTM